MNKNIKILVFIALTLIFVSCFSRRKQETKYYLIEIPSEKLVLDRPENPLTENYCEIENIDINPAYASYRIANRNSSNSLTYYRHHQWAVLPEEFIKRYIYNFFISNHTFKGTSERYWKIEPKYKLITNVEQLEVIEEDEKLYMHLNMVFKLINNNSEEILVIHNFDVKKELEEKKINLFAEEMSYLLYEELSKFNSKIISIE
jgi:ABC-type uncharacterized transport system auxiliary subunit